VEPSYLPLWVDHIVEGYQALPPEARKEFQDLVRPDRGAGDSIAPPWLGEDHEVIKKLNGITVGKLPSSPDDFPRRDRTSKQLLPQTATVATTA